MSLTFLLEAGAHGPIEPELLKLQMSNHTSACPGIRTSSGVLYVEMRYSHATGHTMSKRAEQKNNAATSIRFQDDVLFTTGLLRQLYLLEWSGLHRLLQTAYDDLAAITEEDRLLLLSSVGIAEVEIRMPSQLLAKARKNTRLMAYLSIWLLDFQDLLRDSTCMADKGVVCRLALEGDGAADGVVTLTATGLGSTMVTTHLVAQTETFRGVDGLASLTVAIGEASRFQALPRSKKQQDSEVAVFSVPSRGAADTWSVTSAGRPPSLTSSTTIESEPGEVSLEMRAAITMLPVTHGKEESSLA
jgi:hypothetical protein